MMDAAKGSASLFVKGVLLLCIGLVFLPGVQSAECGGSEPCGCGDTLVESRQLDSADQLEGCQKGLFIRTEDTVLDCGGKAIESPVSAGTGISVHALNVTVHNCSVTGFHSGVAVSHSGGVTLTHNEVNGSYGVGMYVTGSHDGRIRANTITDSRHGIFLTNTTGFVLRKNRAVHNEINGIQLSDATADNLVAHNNCTHNGGHGVAPITCQNLIRDNNLAGQGEPISYHANDESLEIGGIADLSELIFCNVSRSSITDLTFHNGPRQTDGILFVRAHRNGVHNVTFKSVRTGIYFVNSSYNRVTDSRFLQSEYGVRFVWDSHDNNVSGCSFRQNKRHFYARGAPDNVFTRNHVAGEMLSITYGKNATIRMEDNETVFHKAQVQHHTEGMGLVWSDHWFIAVGGGLILVAVGYYFYRYTRQSG